MNAKIIEIIDIGLNKIEEESYSKSSAKYITFAVQKEDAEFILKTREEGRLEVIIQKKIKYDIMGNV